MPSWVLALVFVIGAIYLGPAVALVAALVWIGSAARRRRKHQYDAFVEAMLR